MVRRNAKAVEARNPIVRQSLGSNLGLELGKGGAEPAFENRCTALELLDLGQMDVIDVKRAEAKIGQALTKL